MAFYCIFKSLPVHFNGTRKWLLSLILEWDKNSFGVEITSSKQFEKIFAFIPIFGTFTKISNQMNKNTSISLGNYFDQFVQSRISEGRFKNVSEVIRAGLRLLEEEESKVIALKTAIQEGIDSGIAHDFDPQRHLESLKAKKHSNG